jgi:hypothetical protein
MDLNVTGKFTDMTSDFKIQIMLKKLPLVEF